LILISILILRWLLHNCILSLIIQVLLFIIYLIFLLKFRFVFNKLIWGFRGHAFRFRALLFILFIMRRVNIWFTLLIIESTFLIWLFAFLLFIKFIKIDSSLNYSKVLRIYIILDKVILKIYIEIWLLFIILSIVFLFLELNFIFTFLSGFFWLILWLLLNFYDLWTIFLNFFWFIVLDIRFLIWNFTLSSLFTLLWFQCFLRFSWLFPLGRLIFFFFKVLVLILNLNFFLLTLLRLFNYVVKPLFLSWLSISSFILSIAWLSRWFLILINTLY